MATDHLPQKLRKMTKTAKDATNCVRRHTGLNAFRLPENKSPKRNPEKVKGQTEVPQAISSGLYDTGGWPLLKRQEESASYVWMQPESSSRLQRKQK